MAPWHEIAWRRLSSSVSLVFPVGRMVRDWSRREERILRSSGLCERWCLSEVATWTASRSQDRPRGKRILVLFSGITSLIFSMIMTSLTYQAMQSIGDRRHAVEVSCAIIQLNRTEVGWLLCLVGVDMHIHVLVYGLVNYWATPLMKNRSSHALTGRYRRRLAVALVAPWTSCSLDSELRKHHPAAEAGAWNHFY